MEKTKIMLDSTCDIPAEWIEKLDAEIIPLHVLWEETQETEDDNRDYDDLEHFWFLLDTEEILPKTSQPTPVEFKEKYQRLFDEGYSRIVVLTLSTKMSGTYNSALLASKDYEGKIAVINSRMASSAIAVIGYRVRELLDTGRDIKTVKEIIEKEREAGKFGAFFYVSNFDFLRKGGRVSKFSSFVGSMLNLRVALFIDKNGDMVPFGKSRGSKRAQKFVIKKLKETFKPGSKIRLAMVHSNNIDECRSLENKLKESYEVVESVITPMGKVISSHVGPGTAGLGIQLME